MNIVETFRNIFAIPDLRKRIMFTLALLKSSGFFVVTVASKSLNIPATSDTIMWVTANCTFECDLSDFQVDCATAAVAAVATNANKAMKFFMFSFF